MIRFITLQVWKVIVRGHYRILIIHALTRELKRSTSCSKQKNKGTAQYLTIDATRLSTERASGKVKNHGTAFWKQGYQTERKTMPVRISKVITPQPSGCLLTHYDILLLSLHGLPYIFSCKDKFASVE